jgi:quercetin dioxygenase-like cupin family protein
MMSKRLTDFLEKIKAMKHFDPEADLPAGLVVRSSQAEWIGEEITGNPSRIGVLLDIPARSFEIYLQEIPAGGSSDLQRHPHESVHYLLEGSGYSEIGPERLEWSLGDFIYTPPWVWHRHYNTGNSLVRMLLVENSRLLSHLGINQRDSAGMISYEELKKNE